MSLDAANDITPQLACFLLFGSQEARLNPQHPVFSALKTGFNSFAPESPISMIGVSFKYTIQIYFLILFL
jgi:hypothetical protein